MTSLPRYARRLALSDGFFFFKPLDVKRRWTALLRRKGKITADDALEVLLIVAFFGHNDDITVALSIVDLDMYLSDVYKLLKKVKKPIPDDRKYDFFSVYAKFKLIQTGSRRAASRYYKLALNCMINTAEHKKIDYAYIMYRFGDYNRSMEVINSLLDSSDSDFDKHAHKFDEFTRPVIRTVRITLLLCFNMFYTERFDQLVTCCSDLLSKTLDPELKQLITGILMYSYYQVGKMDQTHKLVLQLSKSNPREISYIIYWSVALVNTIRGNCDLPLNLKLPRPLNVWHFAEEINGLFRGIIAQQSNISKPVNAIWQFHRLNYLAAHPIHDWQMGLCYMELGVYCKGLRYLERAYKNAKGQVPSIENDYSEMCNRAMSMLKALKCDFCGKRGGLDTKLSPCCGCFEVYYCSKHCQKIGWNTRGHRDKCSGEYKDFKKNLKDFGDNGASWDVTAFKACL